MTETIEPNTSAVKNQIGVIGLAPMGKNLAKNLASRDFSTSVYNRSHQKTVELESEKNPNIKGFESLCEFIESLELPRKIILMVKSGDAVDKIISELEPLLNDGDILIDCGNSYWKDTEFRQSELRFKGLHLVGCGVSGGWKGALLGPSIMPSGDIEAVEQVVPFLYDIAAQDYSGEKCVTNVGTGSAGHFVKMVHNGIEYAIMQGIAEVIHILKAGGQTNAQIIDFFQNIQDQTQISGFLIETTIEALRKTDDKGPLLERIESKAGAKGTGSWTVQSALELGVATPTIAEAVFARIISQRDFGFGYAAKSNETMSTFEIANSELPQLASLLETAYLSAFYQGLDLITKANAEYNFGIEIAEICRIWQGGCIVRCKLLLSLNDVFCGQSLSSRIIPKITDELISKIKNIPTSVIDSAQNYLKAALSDFDPQNMTQLQRNIFGDHEIKILE